MTQNIESAINAIISFQKNSGKPFAVILAGHNGSGKSTLWYDRIADRMQIPLINADRMMMSILPSDNQKPLPMWAQNIRDNNPSWMKIAQTSVNSFIANASIQKVPFAVETVFSHLDKLKNGTYRSSKIELIKSLQKDGYFVLLLFIGLRDSNLSLLRVSTRVQQGGHNVSPDKLINRFPRTQKAIHLSLKVADAAILIDNSADPKNAFKVVHIQRKRFIDYDIRSDHNVNPDRAICDWLNVICPER